jgi:predicted choloylglycine hydrolase
VTIDLDRVQDKEELRAEITKELVEQYDYKDEWKICIEDDMMLAVNNVLDGAMTVDTLKFMVKVYDFLEDENSAGLNELVNARLFPYHPDYVWERHSDCDSGLEIALAVEALTKLPDGINRDELEAAASECLRFSTAIRAEV